MDDGVGTCLDNLIAEAHTSVFFAQSTHNLDERSHLKLYAQVSITAHAY